jgi:ATP-dependent DNA helicase RecG
LAKGAQRFPYVRIASNSVVARGENLRKLQELAARIPFDDRVNNQAAIENFDLGLIQAHLQEIKSSLYEESKQIPFLDLCRTMLIAKGPDEDIRPVNVGLLFFCKTPEQFFSRTWIELVWHKDNSGKRFKEVYFKGPIQKQLRDALSFIQTNIVNEKVIKHKAKAEADRFFNYPYEAIEEALSNAVYHKSYELGSPIEIQVFPDKITILSHPGPVPPVNAKILATQRQIIAREYRNRRIGDFLKELHLTEGRGTGFPTIYKAMADNGSPNPLFDTDENTYVLVTLPVHPNASVQESVELNNQDSTQVNKQIFKCLEDISAYILEVTNQVSDQVSDQVKTVIIDELGKYAIDILHAIKSSASPKKQIFQKIGLSNHILNKQRHIDPLQKIGWITYTIPDNPKDRNQKYMLTESGKRLLNLIK